MSENSEIKRSEGDKEYGKQLVDAGNAWRWAMVFNELCDDDKGQILSIFNKFPQISYSGLAWFINMLDSGL